MKTAVAITRDDTVHGTLTSCGTRRLSSHVSVLPKTQSDCAPLSAFQAAPRKTIITENSIHTIKPIAPNSHKSTVLVPALETYFRLSEGLV